MGHPTEWAAVRAVAGDELTAALMGVSRSSLRRYSTGDRATPNDVAARLQFVALVHANLAGSYNNLGIRRWWRRPRSAFDGRSPLDALGRRWDPDISSTAVEIRALSSTPRGPGGAT